MEVFHGSYTLIDKVDLSKVFAQLSDISTQHYLKSWQEIYEILNKELNNK